MYGTQARRQIYRCVQQFENDVNMYGTQAMLNPEISSCWFENDVNMYGTQATSPVITQEN